ncbi:MAG: hypothetical protein ACTS6J_23270 [Burkholderiales bacterium]
MFSASTPFARPRPGIERVLPDRCRVETEARPRLCRQLQLAALELEPAVDGATQVEHLVVGKQFDETRTVLAWIDSIFVAFAPKCLPVKPLSCFFATSTS